MREYLLGSCGLLALISVVCHQVSGQETPCGAGLQCVSQLSCPTFISARNRLETLSKGTPERARLLQKLRSLVCNKERREICCEVSTPTPGSSTDPDSPSYLPSLEEDQCGLEGGSAAFVLGGEDTSIGEFPFLGLLGKERGGTVQWFCGGSIINKWFVLSAAHCGDRVDYVRLGEWKVVDPECEDLEHCQTERRRGEEECGATSDQCQRASQGVDCQTVKGVRTCTAPYQDITVAKKIIHPDYELTRLGLAVNDIMLLKLSRPAVFNNFVRAVCLPSPSLEQFGEVGASKFGNNLPTVVGWGRTSNSRRGGPVSSAPTDVQQKLQMPTRDYGDCLARWQNVLRAVNSDADLEGELSPSLHLCAGGEDGKDSCNGDSGGPLLARKSRISPWQLVGVVSGGTSRCGIGAPGIFTRVTQYREWIRNNLN